jgi:homoserine dehydrogenase
MPEDRGDADRPVRVALLGCGNVGSALVGMLCRPGQADELALRAGVRLELAGIAVRDTSTTRSQEAWFPTSLLTADAKGLIERDDVDVVVELIGAVDPARQFVELALAAGRPVVTGNKALLARAGAELARLATDRGVDLLYEAAVASAIPVIRPLRESLAGERIVRIMGIVNGTTNFILSQMAQDGSSYDEALGEAQRLGLAERDPSADVEGHDAAAKAAILAGLAFGTDVVVDDVHREGITKISASDVRYAGQLGYVIKLLAVAERVGERAISVRVHPAMVPLSHPLATVGGAFNAVFIEGENAGELMLYGQGAGGEAAASAVLGDLIVAARHLLGGGSTPAPPRHMPVEVIAVHDLASAFYLSMDVVDRPGVLAAVASVMGEHGVSIRWMEQKGLADEARLIFLTHSAQEGAMSATVAALEHLNVVDRIGGVLRVISPEGAEPSAPGA